jgi:hypothetical protein
MGVLDKLSRLVVGGVAAASRDAVAALSSCYVECVRRARQLTRHAHMAPQPYSAEGLRELAAAEDRQAEALHQALLAAQAAIPSVALESPPADALNHWGRLVRDLEAHRSSVRRLRELAVHFAETLPHTAALFDELCTAETIHCQRIRELIVRADPQALD